MMMIIHIYITFIVISNIDIISTVIISLARHYTLFIAFLLACRSTMGRQKAIIYISFSLPY